MPGKRARPEIEIAGEKYFTVDVAAEKLGVHRDTVLKMIGRNELIARRFGKSWRLREVDLVPAPYNGKAQESK